MARFNEKSRNVGPVRADPILHVLKEVIVLSVRSTSDEVDRDLSQRQLSVLLIIGLEDVEHRVGNLADRLKVSKTAITRAVDRLEEFHFVRRENDPNDGRSIILNRTATGNAYIRQLSRFTKRAETHAEAA